MTRELEAVILAALRSVPLDPEQRAEIAKSAAYAVVLHLAARDLSKVHDIDRLHAFGLALAKVVTS